MDLANAGGLCHFVEYFLDFIHRVDQDILIQLARSVRLLVMTSFDALEALIDPQRLLYDCPGTPDVLLEDLVLPGFSRPFLSALVSLRFAAWNDLLHSFTKDANNCAQFFEIENGFCKVISEQLLADVSLQLAVLFVEKIEGSLTQFVGYSSFSVSSRAGANELGEIHSRLQ